MDVVNFKLAAITEMSAVRSHNLSIGIVGLPNSGKSTLFNSLTENAVPAENFPFCTIDKNVGIVEVPDTRLQNLSTFYNAEKTVPSAITFVDIAGLVKGAADGEGLGNQFLSHIREVDVIMFVLRIFESDTISHVYERIDPYDDLQIVTSELVLKDIETADKRLTDLKKRARASTEKLLHDQVDFFERLMSWFEDGKPAVEMDMTEDEKDWVYDLHLLSIKPRMFVLNIRAGVEDKQLEERLNDFRKQVGPGNADFILPLDVKTLGEIQGLSDEEKKEMFEMLDSEPFGSNTVIDMVFRKLELITFYTGSEKECNAWSIRGGATAQQAAGVIHTDLAEGFVTAEVVNVDKLVEAGGMVGAKEAGLVQNQGKEYVVQDGDYIIVNSRV